MLDLTTEAKQAWLAQTRQVSARITIGTTVYNADKIMSVEYDRGSISGETFQIGSFYQNSIKVVLVGILESLTNDNKVKLEFAVKVGSDFVWTNMGAFYVSEFDRDRNSNRTTFTAVDGSVYLGSAYNPTITFPNSLKNLVTDIANQCGVQVNFASMTHLADENVTQPPSKYTCRQVISMVAQIHGGFARINRNDELEVTRLMSTDLELNPSQYLLKGLVKNETTYRTDGIIVKTGDNDTDKIQVGTVTGSAVINLENPLMTQQLLDTMWRTVSTISYYPFTLKWRGIPNLEAGDWITIVDKQGTRFRVPNLSYKLSFKGGLSATSSADTTATSNVQHRLRGTLTQRVEDVEGYINASGGRSYTGLDVPDNEYLKKGDTWYKPDGDDTAILVYDGEKWEEVASPEVFRQLQADFDELDKQAKEAFDDVTEIKDVKIPEVERLAKQADDSAKAAEQALTTATTSLDNAKTAMQNATKEFTDTLEQTKNSFTAQIGGLTVGGRNLFLDAAFKSEKISAQNDYTAGSWHVWDNKTSYSLVDYNNLKYFKYNAQQSEYRQGIMQFFTPETLQCGRTHSVRTFVKVSQPMKMAFNVIKRNTDGSFNWYFDVKTYDIQPSDNFSEMKWQFKIPETDDGVLYGVAIVNVTGSIDCDICIYKPMLEAGTLFSDFVLAPEDYNNDLSNMGLSLTKTITESLDHKSEEFAKTYLTKADNNTWLNGSYKTFHDQTSEYIKQSTQSFETLGADVGDAKTNAQNALTSATNAVSAANAANTTASEAINKATDLINKVAGFESKVTTYETNYKNDRESFNQETKKITTIQDKLNNMYIGGRNLFIDAGFKKEVRITNDYDTGYWYSYVGTKFNYPKFDDDCNYLYFTASSDNQFGVMQFFDTNKLIKGQTYSVRTQVKVDANTTFRYQLIKKNQNSSYNWHFKYSDTTVTTIGEWVDVKWTFTIPKDDDAMRYGVAIRNLQTGTNIAILMLKPKIEIGNMYTGFSLAPEDTQKQIDTISNDLSNNYYSKNQINTEVINGPNGVISRYTQDITNRLVNYYTTSQIDSKINIDGEGISEYVKRTQSQLNNLSIGNENLLADAAFKDKIAETNASNYVEGKWVKYNGGTIDIWKYSNEINGIKFEPTQGLNTGVMQFINPNYIQIGKEYCLRFYVLCRKPITVNSFLMTKSGDTITWYRKTLISKNITQYGTYVEISTKFKLEDFGSVDLYGVSIFVGGTADNVGYPIWIMQPKLEQGNVFTNFSISTLSLSEQGLSVIKRADKMETTLYDSTTGLVTKTTQLAGKYAIQNLNSYGDVLSSLNLNGGNVRIKGELIDLDGNVRIQDAFVTNLKANSILANEITAQATTVVNAKIANLDAGVITTGILKGTNLSLNLGTGDVQFKKGRIQAPNNTLDIQVDTGIMKVLNTNGEGVTFQNGNLYFSNATEQSYFGSLIYNNQLFSNAFKGVSLIGKNAFQLKTSNYTDFVLSYTKQIGSGISASPNGMVLQSDKRVNIIGGQPSGELTTPAMVSIGTAHGSYSSNGNGVTIDGYSDGIYLRVVNGGKISMFGDVEFITGTITGPIVKSTDFSIKNMAFVFSMSGSYINVETSFGTFKLPVSS